MTTPDVIVVGAGIAGAAVARRLAPELAVVVLERGPAPAGEATGQSSGMIRRLVEDPVERALAVRAAELREVDPWPGAGARLTGGVVGLVDDLTLLHDAAAHLRARGIEVRDATGAGLLAGSAVRAAWRVEEHVVDPAEVARAWLAPLEVRTRERALGLVIEGGRAVGVRTDGGVRPAGAVVLAAGAWCAGLAPTPRALVPLRRPVFRLRGPDPAGHPWIWVEDRGLWVRPEATTWLASACEEVPEAAPDGPSTGAPGPADLARLRARIDEVLPVFSRAEVVDAWSGLRTFAPDRRPLLGPDPALPGLHWLAGLGGYGITVADAAAEAVAAWLRGGEVPWLRRRPVAPDRPAFARFPIRPTGDAARSVLHRT